MVRLVSAQRSSFSKAITGVMLEGYSASSLELAPEFDAQADRCSWHGFERLDFVTDRPYKPVQSSCLLTRH
jgi:hypothetical protein